MDLFVIYSSRVHLLVLERNDKTILKKGYYDTIWSTERTLIIDILKLSLPIAKAKKKCIKYK